MLAGPIAAVAALGIQHRSLRISGEPCQHPTYIVHMDVPFKHKRVCKNTGTCTSLIAETH